MSDTAPDPNPKARRLPMVLGIALGALLVLGAAGLLALDSLLTSRARQEAARMSRELGRPVEVGGVSTRVITGLGLRLSDLRVGPGPGEELPLAEVRRIEVKASLLRAVLSGGKDVPISSAEVEGLRVNVIRLPDGTTNVERLQRSLAGPAPGEPGGPPPEAGKAKGDLSFLRIDRAALVDARVALLDRGRRGAPELAIDHLDVTVADLRAGRPLDVVVKAAVLAEKQNVEIRVHAAPLPPTLSPAFETVVLKVEPIDLAPLAPFVPSRLGLEAGHLQAALEAAFGAAVPGGSGPTRVKGGFRVEGLAFKGGRPLDALLDADLDGDLVKGDLAIGKLRLDLGPAGITGRGRVSGLSGGELRVEGLELVARDLDLARLAAHFPPLARWLGGRVAGPIGLSLHGSGSGAKPALELRADLTPVRLDLPGTLFKPAGGRMTLAARLGGAAPGAGALGFEASADLSGVDLRPGGQMAKPPGRRLQLSLAGTRRSAGEDETFEVRSAELGLLDDTVTASATVTRSGAPGREVTRFRAKVESARLDLDKLLLPEPKKARRGKAGPAAGEPHRPASFAGLSGEAQVHVGLLRMRKVDARDVRLLVRLAGDEVVVEKGEAAAFGGSLSAAGTKVRLAHPQEPFQVKVTARKVELAEALAPFSKRKILSGRFDGEMDLKGAGREEGDLARTLAGLLSGRVLDGAFHGKDLVAGVTGPLARLLPFGVAGKEGKGGATSLGREQPFEVELKDGLARLKKPIQVERPEARIELTGGFRLDGTLDMPATVALSPQTVATITGGKARPAAPIPVRFRLTGPAWGPSLSEMDLGPAVSAIVKEAGSAAVGRALGLPGEKAEPADLRKKAQEEAKKRLRGLFGR